jgi:hypothetical protein
MTYRYPTPKTTLTDLDAEELARMKERVVAANSNQENERFVEKSVRAILVRESGYEDSRGEYIPPCSWFYVEGPRGAEFRIEVRPYARRPKRGPATYVRGGRIAHGTLQRLRVRASA